MMPDPSRLNPCFHAIDHPDRIALKIMPRGEAVSYRALEERSNQAAHLLRSLGLHRGDVIAILMENNARYFELAWAAERSGLYFTCISHRLSAPEITYIVQDSGARIMISSFVLAALAGDVAEQCPGLRYFMVDGATRPFASYEEAVAPLPCTPIADESQGMPMLYSSGTTGRPKGVRIPLPEEPFGSLDGLTRIAIDRFGFEPGMLYLSPAPMYHSAPLRWSMCVHRLGGTVVAMEKFDAEYALRLIEEERITHSQWVPTHFVRMLKLPPETRTGHDLSSHRLTFHAAAPCPVAIKQAMMEWWGPIIREYYAGTEFNGLTSITPEEWLARPGSVGRATFGTIHIVGDDGAELPPRREGLIYFEGGTPFAYHNDPAKTAEAYNDRGWSMLGDIGWVDEDGYLYLTDRKSFMIISGGVNIYPQEIEDAILTHPRVADVAVVGAPDEDMGEKVVAIIQPMDWSEAGSALARDIEAHLRQRLGGIKIPRQFDFSPELPRHPTGKLYKRLLRDQYWADPPEKPGVAMDDTHQKEKHG